MGNCDISCSKLPKLCCRMFSHIVVIGRKKAKLRPKNNAEGLILSLKLHRFRRQRYSYTV